MGIFPRKGNMMVEKRRVARLMTSFSCIVLATCSLTTLPQTSTEESFHFKAAYLGMPLDEFKKAMEGDLVWVNTGKPGWNGRPSKKFARHVQTPLCTDTMRDFPGDTLTLADGEVLCNAAPGATNEDLLQVGKETLIASLYRFYQGRLYRIDLIGYSKSYATIKSLFIEKYGPTTKTGTTSFQNGFGALWTGEKVEWMRPKSALLIREGSGNGPGQPQLSEKDPLIANFIAFDLAPPDSKPDALNF